ncbi:MAG: hypothetical protein ACLU09_11940 [Clostridium sp.]
MSTVIYAGSTSDMAFSIGHEYDIHKINRESFRQEAAQVGLGERVAMQHYDRLADRIDEALDKTCETLVSQGFENDRKSEYRISVKYHPGTSADWELHYKCGNLNNIFHYFYKDLQQGRIGITTCVI